MFWAKMAFKGLREFWAWPSKTLKKPWKINVCVCVATQKRLLGLILNHVAPSWAQNGFKMAQDDSRLLQEGLMGPDISKKLILPWFF